jgi:hypothetical protein
MPPYQGDAQGLQRHRIAYHLDVGQAGQQLAEHHRQLAPRQVGAEAEVRTRTAETNVRVGVPADVEGLGVVEHARVAVGGAVEQHDLVALVEVVARECQRPGGRAPHERDGRRRPHDLLHRLGCGALDVGLPLRPLARVLGEQVHAVADAGPGGVVAGHRQQDEERRQLAHVLVVVMASGRGQHRRLEVGLDLGEHVALAAAEGRRASFPRSPSRPGRCTGRCRPGTGGTG